MEHVTKHYARRRVFDDVSLTFPTGSFTLLTGPNGSGKTTLLRLLSTYAQPSAGTVHWVDRDGTELRDAADIRARLGYAGHAPLLWDELTVRENLQLQSELRGARLEPEILERFDLAGRADERADTLSRGLRQRASLAAALAHRPQFLLLDEPASNLDAASLARLVAVLEAGRGHATTVLATHEPDHFRRLADRTLEIDAGRIIEYGAAQ